MASGDLYLRDALVDGDGAERLKEEEEPMDIDDPADPYHDSRTFKSMFVVRAPKKPQVGLLVFLITLVVFCSVALSAVISIAVTERALTPYIKDLIDEATTNNLLFSSNVPSTAAAASDPAEAQSRGSPNTPSLTEADQEGVRCSPSVVFSI
ncbi:hypothetical protein Efla_007732 [Eimeria flavescens]